LVLAVDGWKTQFWFSPAQTLKPAGQRRSRVVIIVRISLAASNNIAKAVPLPTDHPWELHSPKPKDHHPPMPIQKEIPENLVSKQKPNPVTNQATATKNRYIRGKIGIIS
jgi:hypothetical protein